MNNKVVITFSPHPTSGEVRNPSNVMKRLDFAVGLLAGPSVSRQFDKLMIPMMYMKRF
jgi:hypothetical protein